jgi:hypothetical protein
MSKSRDRRNRKDLDTSGHSESDRESGQEDGTFQRELDQEQPKFLGAANKPDLDSALDKLKILFEQMDINKDEVCKAFIAQQVTYDSKFESLMKASIKLGNDDAWTLDSSEDQSLKLFVMHLIKWQKILSICGKTYLSRKRTFRK